MVGKASLASDEVHILSAIDDSWSRASFNSRRAGTDASGNQIISSLKEVQVLSTGKSVAVAGVNATEASVTLVSVGVVQSSAKANALFEAFAGANEGADMTIGTLSVKAEYTMQAFAYSAQPKFGISVANVSNNKANAQVGGSTLNGRAYLYSRDGKGTLNVTGSVLVQAVETDSKAFAKILGSVVDISGASIGSNEAQSHLNIHQQAGAEGLRITADSVTIESLIGSNPAAQSHAITGSTGGTGLSGFNSNVNTSKAYASASNFLKVSNAVIEASGLVLLKADTNTSAKAEANGRFEASLAVVGGLYAESGTSDETLVDIDDSQIISTTNKVSVLSNSNTHSEAISEKPASASLYSNAEGLTKATVGGNSEADYQTAKISISGKSLIAGYEDVEVKALNQVSLTSSERAGVTVAAVSGSKSVALAVDHLLTEITLGQDSVLRTSYRNPHDADDHGIEIYAKDELNVREVVDGTSVALKVSSDGKYAQINSTTKTRIKVYGTVDSAGYVRIHTDSDAEQKAITSVVNAELFSSGSYVKAVNALTRTVTITIGSATAEILVRVN